MLKAVWATTSHDNSAIHQEDAIQRVERAAIARAHANLRQAISADSWEHSTAAAENALP